LDGGFELRPVTRALARFNFYVFAAERPRPVIQIVGDGFLLAGNAKPALTRLSVLTR